MDKLIQILLASVMCVSLVACSSKTSGQASSASSIEPETSAEETTENTDNNIEVDEHLLSVEINIPASFYEGKTQEEILEEAKDLGEAKFNEDGSLNLKMSKSKHREWLKQYADAMKESFDEIVADTENSVSKIDISDDFSDFTVTVNKAAFESGADGMYVLTFWVGGYYYQLFSGVDEDSIKVLAHFIDESTGEVFEDWDSDVLKEQ